VLPFERLLEETDEGALIASTIAGFIFEGTFGRGKAGTATFAWMSLRAAA